MSFINREKVLGEIIEQLRLFKGEENSPENQKAIDQIYACWDIVGASPEPESVAIRIKDYANNYCKCGACKKRIITPLVLDLENGETVFCPKCGVKLTRVVNDDIPAIEVQEHFPLAYDSEQGKNVYTAEEAGEVIKRQKEGRK